MPELGGGGLSGGDVILLGLPLGSVLEHFRLLVYCVMLKKQSLIVI
jgi:hypothetical protein